MKGGSPPRDRRIIIKRRGYKGEDLEASENFVEDMFLLFATIISGIEIIIYVIRYINLIDGEIEMEEIIQPICPIEEYASSGRNCV